MADVTGDGDQDIAARRLDGALRTREHTGLFDEANTRAPPEPVGCGWNTADRHSLWDEGTATFEPVVHRNAGAHNGDLAFHSPAVVSAGGTRRI
ncbi:hypothetical protein [Actinosynnema pretiosum]|uniref:hypothetical protein n=1 Tax=Actinosynnema pretiosum TaxID=42197 RepID=UPI0012FDCC37|nr:hypothetical protein [Actinosynnema pretiosum]